jgi:hypothetical protein
MRKMMFALLAVSAAGFTTMAGTAPAAAYDYPYCLQGGGFGIPGECLYRSYAECRASASGRRADCNINPRVAFGQQSGRAHRRYDHRDDRY